MARRKASRTATSKRDEGTPETARRMSADPLLDVRLDTHRATAGFAIRMAVEEGLGASGLDMVRIGMGGGSQGYNPHGWTPKEHLIDARASLAHWRVKCAALKLRNDWAEAFACGDSCRRIAVAAKAPRTRVTQHVHDALDLYADMKG